MPFAFYDLETTGRSAAFDHPLQFAAIYTDDDFNVLETVNLRCRLSPHVLPSPGALAVTGVSLDQITDPTLPSWFEMMGEIREIIERWSPSTWTGFNSLRFDDPMMRQSFFQTLQPQVYAMQLYGNSRLDVMAMMYAVYVFQTDCFEWPLNGLGKLSFKLEDLAAANGFNDHVAHDALGDVRATIHLLDQVRSQAPDVYRQFLRNRDKQHVIELLRSGQSLQIVERFGGPPRSVIGVGCGFDASYPGRGIFLDVTRVDPRELETASVADLVGLIGQSPKVVKPVKTNATPALFALSDADPMIADRAAYVGPNSDLQERMGRAMAQHYSETYPPPGDDEEIRVEDRIYHGFYSLADKERLTLFQSCETWEERVALMGGFEDDRLQQLAMRLVFLERPDLLSECVGAAASANLLARWTADEVPENGWSTFSSVETELQKIEASGEIDAQQAADLREFYAERRRTVEAIAGAH
ncbi:exonuclease domain-containing protein [Boseongicola aestuarii]|uniref:Exodeoxyribonuclease I n=1 Tax=Boseongicola aestuarii TaxID=1470561 RepID=A0A238J3Q2_9RHOB|nr:exonuclease domain-containing protein [Boseongicola aestuarii]SMX25286.1 Exodeoxyribonuclease I [Boseongicola aestuarii]